MTLAKGLYRHYKGNLYEVMMTAQHSETEEWMVVYNAKYGDEGTWVRLYRHYLIRHNILCLWKKLKWMVR